MARVVKKFPDRKRQKPPIPDTSDVDKFLDGQIWEIELGDLPKYKNLDLLLIRLRYAAKYQGKKIRSVAVKSKGRVYVQAISQKGQ